MVSIFLLMALLGTLTYILNPKMTPMQLAWTWIPLMFWAYGHVFSWLLSLVGVNIKWWLAAIVFHILSTLYIAVEVKKAPLKRW